ncbi:MAG TPA: hypothetical protein PLM51_05835 [Bacillota bacterium]|nr:hypothetical protein [Bacillota bacterium]
MSRKAKLAERIVYASKAARIAKTSRLGIFVSVIMTFLIFSISYYGEVVGNFTFRIDKNSYEAGLSLVKDPDTEEYTSVLFADKVENADGMTCFCGTEYSLYDVGDDVCLPADAEITSINGSHNGENYLAYTFYLENAGIKVVDLQATINLLSTTRGADESVRVRLFVNDEAETYARAQSSRGANPGEPEIGTTPFEAEYVVVQKQFSAFAVGEQVKITILIWYEGEDADHNNDIIGGGVKFEMVFHITYIYEDNEIPNTTIEG